MSSTSPIVETSIDLDMTPGAVMPVVNASQTDDLRLLTIYLYANGTQYILHSPSSSHEELSIVLNGKKPDGNIFSYKCEFDYDSNKVWAYFNRQMTAVAGEVLCELVVYATSTEEEDAEPRQVGSANFVLQVEESPTGGPDSESTLQSLDQIRHELGIAVVDSRQSAANAAESKQNAALSASQAADSASKAAESEKNAALSASQASQTAHRALFSAEQAAKAEAAAKSWAVGPSGTGSGTDTNNSKYYHDQVYTKYTAFMNAMDLAFNLEIEHGQNDALSINHTFQEISDAFSTYGHLVAFLNYHPNSGPPSYYIGTVYLVNDINILFTFNMSTKTTTHIMTYTLTSDGQLLLTYNYEQVNQAQLTPGTNITIDNTDPDNPVISASGGGNVDAPLFVCTYPDTVTCNLTFAKIEEIYAGTGDTKASMPQLIYKPSSISDNGTRSAYCDVTRYDDDTFIFAFNMGYGKGINQEQWQERIIEIQFKRGDSLSKIADYTLEYQKPVVAGDGINIRTQGAGINQKSQISVDSSMIMIGNASGSVASFIDGADNIPLTACIVAIEPVQSGSGDPSPQNRRLISGWTKCEVTVKDDLTTPTETETYNIEFKDDEDNTLTVYGGTLDVTDGELTVDRAIVDLGTLDWEYSATQRLFEANLVDGIRSDNAHLNGICEIYKCVQGYNPNGGINDPKQDNAFAVGSTFVSINWNLLVRDSRYTDATAFKTAMNGVKCVYKLATPTTYDLTPTEVKTLLGINHIFADCGDVKVEYTRDATSIINWLISQINLGA